MSCCCSRISLHSLETGRFLLLRVAASPWLFLGLLPFAVLAVFLGLNLSVKLFQECRQFFSGARCKGQSNTLFLPVLANDSKPSRRGTRCVPVGTFRNDSKKLFVGNYSKSIWSFHLPAVSERNSTCSGKERPELNQVAYGWSFSGEEFPYLG